MERLRNVSQKVEYSGITDLQKSIQEKISGSGAEAREQKMQELAECSSC